MAQNRRAIICIRLQHIHFGINGIVRFKNDAGVREYVFSYVFLYSGLVTHYLRLPDFELLYLYRSKADKRIWWVISLGLRYMYISSENCCYFVSFCTKQSRYCLSSVNVFEMGYYVRKSNARSSRELQRIFTKSSSKRGKIMIKYLV